MVEDKGNPNHLRGKGILKPLVAYGNCLAEAIHNAIITCYDNGARVETPKHKKGMSLGYDAPISVGVLDADAEPKIYFPAMHDTPLGVLQYILEMTHGIHNHWKKTPEEPNFWGYTYNERFVDQLPFVFQRIKADWEDKKAKEGEGRITGRDYHFTIWRPGEDIILEQQDPPCKQIGDLRYLQDENGEWVQNYLNEWRSRDEFKAWNENVVGQIGSKSVPGLMRLFRDKVSNILGIPIKLGSYTDYSSSLHLYGLYVDRDNLHDQIAQMKRDGWENKSLGLDDYLLSNEWGYDIPTMKRLIACQSDAEAKGHGKQQPVNRLKELGYNIETFPYPSEWDSWPKSWDAKPDPSKLARVF